MATRPCSPSLPSCYPPEGKTVLTGQREGPATTVIAWTTVCGICRRLRLNDRVEVDSMKNSETSVECPGQ